MNTDAPASAYSLDHVADDELLLSTRRLVGRSNQLLAALLAHLGEVEARGIHRERSCVSLYTYCVFDFAYLRTPPSAERAPPSSPESFPSCSNRSPRAKST